MHAAKHLNVAQLEKLLDTATRTRKSDAEIARQLGGSELTERLTQARLGTFKARLAADSEGARALELLADRSAFLDPPASEIPAAAPPDNAAQTAVLNAARTYVSQMLPRLPNFLATRVIDLYDDSPQALKKGEWPTRSGLHLVGTSSGEISVRNERENQPATQGSAVWKANIGLISGGEFGNTLGMILSDATKGSMTWSHWEEFRGAKVAVFHYVVPASASHYEVLSTLKREESVEGVATPDGGDRGIKGIEARSNVNGLNVTIVHSRPGYHGAIWVNPADGSILRITMDADLTKGAPFRRAAILVEYGPVEIGGSTFICPIRSIALSVALTGTETVTGNAPSEWLNETHFTNYHRFGSSTRILTESTNAPAVGTERGESAATATVSTPGMPPAPEKQTGNGSIAEDQPPQAELETAPAPSATLPVAETGTSGTNEVIADDGLRAPPAPAVSAPPVLPATQPTTATAAPMPTKDVDISPNADVPDSGVKLRMEAQELLIPVVVRDRSGHAVGDLAKQDFTVFDQGKARTITGFTLIESARGRELGSSGGSTAPPASLDSATRPGGAHRFIVFLFDDRHVTASDFAITQKAAVRMLDEPLAAGDYGAVLSLTGANSGFTRDRATLQAAIMKLSVHQASQHVKEDCPDVDYYAADKIIHQHDPTEFQVTVLKAKSCSHLKIQIPTSSNLYAGMDDPSDPFQRMAMAAAMRALAQGEEDSRQTLVQIEAVVRAMTKLPGQRTLILLSPGFLSLSPDAIAFKSQILDQAAGANVVINALDVRGLYVGNPDASEGANASISQIAGDTSSDYAAGMLASENAMSELANGTGGTFFHNSNDLQGGLKILATAPEYVYLLGVSLQDVKRNGTFHQLKVKVDGHDLEVQYRRGYFAPKPLSSTK